MATLIDRVKKCLRNSDYTGDRWGVAMGAMFDCCAMLYEIGDVPDHWGFSVGWGGNELPEDSDFFHEFQFEYDEDLIIVGEYLFRLTSILEKSEHKY